LITDQGTVSSKLEVLALLANCTLFVIVYCSGVRATVFAGNTPELISLAIVSVLVATSTVNAEPGKLARVIPIGMVSPDDELS